MASAINVNVPPNDYQSGRSRRYSAPTGRPPATRSRRSRRGCSGSATPPPGTRWRQPQQGPAPCGTTPTSTSRSGATAANWRDAINAGGIGTLTGDLERLRLRHLRQQAEGVSSRTGTTSPWRPRRTTAASSAARTMDGNPTTLTWNDIGDFACLVHADIPAGQTVVINGTGTTNATIPAGCCATLLQVTSNTQNVWISTPRVVVGT